MNYGERIMVSTEKNNNTVERKTGLFDHSPDAIFIMDSYGRFLDVNKTACSMLGYIRDELLALSVEELFPSDDGISISPEFFRLEDTGTFTTRARIKKKDGTLLSIRLHSEKMPDGKCIAFFADITEFENAENTLLQSRQQLSMIADNIPALVTSVCARDLIYIYVNRTFADAFSMSPEQITGRKISEILGNDAYMRALPFIERAKSGERVTYENKIALHGEHRWYNIDYMPEFDEHGAVINIIVLMLDITGHRHAGKILRESENRFRMLFEQSPDLNLIMTKNGLVTHINAVCLEVTGYQSDEITGRYFIDAPFIIPETVQQFYTIYHEALAGNQVRDLEVAISHKKGMILYFEVFINPIVEDDSIKIFQIILRNITKRKKAEEELHISEEKFRFIVENSMMPMIIASLKDYTVIFYNSYASEFFLDTSPAGTIRASNYWVRPTERDDFIGILKEKGTVHTYEAELKTRDGKYKWCLLSAKIINYLGQTASFVMFNDITELKHTQKALLESENRFHRLTENAKDMIYRKSLSDGRYEYVNNSSVDITGYTPRELYDATRKSSVENMHPDYTEYFNEVWKNLQDDKVEPFYEYKYLHKDGRERWHNQRLVIVHDETGSPIAIEGIVTDITGRKQAEMEREKLIGELKKALADVKQLSGLLPICASCKKIRNDKGYWEQIEGYIRDRSEADFSHGICPDCAKKLYSGFYKEK